METKIYTEKYRPKTLSEVIGHKDIVDRLKLFVEAKNVNNSLFAGLQGIGKTTCAIAMAKDLYGEDWKSCFFELNASDARGIEVVRKQIKGYCKQAPMRPYKFKIIFLDEFDAMTNEAMNALRRLMEQYTESTRFILSCNYFDNIIPPIQSRCSIFMFSPMSKMRVIKEGHTENEVEKYLKPYINRICQEEKIKIDEKAVATLADLLHRDLRKLMNVLQELKLLSELKGKRITIDDVNKRVYEISEEQVRELLLLAMNNREFESKLTYLLNERCYTPKQIHNELWKIMKDASYKDDEKRENVYKIIGEGARDIQYGVNSYFALYNMLWRLGKL